MADQQPDQQPAQPAEGQASQGQMYCSECGASISRRAEICPACGVRIQSNSDSSGMLTGNQWLIVGGFAAVAGVFALAIVFAPLAIIAGSKLRQYPPADVPQQYHDLVAYGLMVVGGIEVLLWINTMIAVYNRLGVW